MSDIWSKKVHWSSCKVPCMTVRFQWKFNFLNRFSIKKTIKCQISWNSVSGSRAVPCRHTEGQTWKSFPPFLRTRPNKVKSYWAYRILLSFVMCSLITYDQRCSICCDKDAKDATYLKAERKSVLCVTVICFTTLAEWYHTNLNFGAGIIFLILAHPVYKMWIIQVPNMLELWNKLHFEEKKAESIYRV